MCEALVLCVDFKLVVQVELVVLRTRDVRRSLCKAMALAVCRNEPLDEFICRRTLYTPLHSGFKFRRVEVLIEFSSQGSHVAVHPSRNSPIRTQESRMHQVQGGTHDGGVHSSGSSLAACVTIPTGTLGMISKPASHQQLDNAVRHASAREYERNLRSLQSSPDVLLR